MKVLVLCFIGVLVLQLTDEGEAVCCPTHRLKKNLLCDDCKDGTPFCGKGRCNMFGCNCEGGCRRGLCGGDDEDARRRRRNPSAAHDVIRSEDPDWLLRSPAAHDVIRSADESELRAHLARRGVPAWLFLGESDLDKDEFLSPEEVDPK